MENRKFWFISLCTFLIVAVSFGWNMPLRISVATNSIVVLLNVINKIRGFKYD